MKRFKLFLLAAVTVFALVPQQASAISAEQLDLYASEIIWYDTDGGPIGICVGNSSGGAMVGTENAEITWNYLRSRGLSEIHTAGFMGNFAFESGFNPTALNPNGGAFGLAQWLGVRKTQLYDYASARGVDVTSLATQLDFVWFELTGEEPVAGIAGGLEAAAYRAVLATTTVAQAAEVVDRRYERSELTHIPERIALAEAAYVTYTGTAVPASGSASCSGGGVGVSGDFVFPLRGQQSTIDWCEGNCHGSYWGGTYYAYDIFANNGTEVLAVQDGTIRGYNPSYNCSAGPQLSMWLETDEGIWYFYQHLDATHQVVSSGDRVSAGQKLGRLGPNAYVGGTCSNTPSHVHFAAGTERVTSMRRDCPQTSCPNMDKLFDVSDTLKAAYAALPQ